jgi:hypothetical protein
MISELRSALPEPGEHPLNHRIIDIALASALAWHEQVTLLGFYLRRPERLPLAWRNQCTVLGLAFARIRLIKPSPSSTLRYWNLARQRYCRPSAPYDRATPVSPERATCSAPHTRAKSPAFRRRRGISRETRTVRWSKGDSNSPSHHERQRSEGRQMGPSHRSQFRSRALLRSAIVLRGSPPRHRPRRRLRPLGVRMLTRRSR